MDREEYLSQCARMGYDGMILLKGMRGYFTEDGYELCLIAFQRRKEKE